MYWLSEQLLAAYLHEVGRARFGGIACRASSSAMPFESARERAARVASKPFRAPDVSYQHISRFLAHACAVVNVTGALATTPNGTPALDHQRAGTPGIGSRNSTRFHG